MFQILKDYFHLYSHRCPFIFSFANIFLQLLLLLLNDNSNFEQRNP